MNQKFNVLTTTGFERDVKHILKRNSKALQDFERVLKTLKIDPYNISNSHNIKKLSSIKPGMGQYRRCLSLNPNSKKNIWGG